MEHIYLTRVLKVKAIHGEGQGMGGESAILGDFVLAASRVFVKSYSEGFAVHDYGACRLVPWC